VAALAEHHEVVDALVAVALVGVVVDIEPGVTAAARLATVPGPQERLGSLGLPLGVSLYSSKAIRFSCALLACWARPLTRRSSEYEIRRASVQRSQRES
jgi:hypothetical protein